MSYILIGIIAVLVIGTLIGESGMAVLIAIVGFIVYFFISNVMHTASLFRKRK